MKLIATNAVLYWLAVKFDLPEGALYVLGITGCIAGALFLRELFRANLASLSRRWVSYGLLVWLYPLCLITYAALITPGIELNFPIWIGATAGILAVIYPMGQIVIAILLRNFARISCNAAPAF